MRRAGGPGRSRLPTWTWYSATTATSSVTSTAGKPPALCAWIPHARRTPRQGAGCIAATARGSAARRAPPGRRHAVRHRLGSDALRPPVRLGRPGMVCSAEPAIGTGLAGRLASQPVICRVHVQAARAGCDALSVALTLAWLSIRPRSDLVLVTKGRFDVKRSVARTDI